MKNALRTVAGVFAGLMSITLIAEGIEFGLVTALHGSVTQDPQVYFGVRNQPWVLGLKLLYNTVAALAGGWVCAWIAGRLEMLHGMLLAVVQTAGFIYGMTASPYANTTPLWMWIALTVLSAVAIVWSAHLRSRKKSAAAAT